MKFPKRLATICSILLLAAVVAATGCSKPAEPGQVAEKDTLQRIKESGKLIVGLDDAFPPFGFRNEKNELVGFDIDLGEALAEHLGIAIEWHPAEWSGIIPSLKSKKFDAIWSGMSVTEKRREEVNFTNPYIGSGQVIILASDNTEIKGRQDMAGKIVGTQIGSTGEVACGQLKDLKELKTYDIYTEAINDLRTGRLNAVVIDDITARYYLIQQPGAFQVLDDILSYEPMAIAVRKEDTTLLAALNEAIEDMIEDGTYKAISERWFGEDMSKYLNQ